MPTHRFRPLSIAALIAAAFVNAGCVSTSNSIWTFSDQNPSSQKVEELPAAKNAQLHWALAENLAKDGNHDAEAAAAYEKARSLDPHLTNVSRRLAPLYDRMGQTKRALEEYHLALKAAPRDAQLLNQYGYFYYSRGQWKDAETQFRQALAINPKLPHAWGNLGLTLAQEKHYDESLEAFGKVVTRAEALSNVAVVLLAQGQRDQAKQMFREALALNANLEVASAALRKLEAPPAPPTMPAAAPTTVSSAAPAPLPDLRPIIVDGPGNTGFQGGQLLKDR